MKTNLPRLLLLFAFVATGALRAADDPSLADVRAADDERVAATIAADRARLDAIFSADLRYAHSSGKIDTKASYIQSLLGGSTKYFSIQYDEREFKRLAPGVVLMTGRAAFKTENDGTPTNFHLGFLAVWREENGRWRFVAWQSCRLTPPGAPAGAAKK